MSPAHSSLGKKRKKKKTRKKRSENLSKQQERWCWQFSEILKLQCVDKQCMLLEMLRDKMKEHFGVNSKGTFHKVLCCCVPHCYSSLAALIWSSVTVTISKRRWCMYGLLPGQRCVLWRNTKTCAVLDKVCSNAQGLCWKVMHLQVLYYCYSHLNKYVMNNFLLSYYQYDNSLWKIIYEDLCYS